MTTRFRTLLIVCSMLALLATPAVALAADPRQGDTVIVGPNEVINDDLYAFGATVDIQGTVNGDVVAAGGNVTVGGTVTGNVLAAGGTVNVSGRVDGTVRASGANVVVSGPVARDVVVGGSTLQLGPESSVGRDLLVGGGATTMNGQVTRNILGGAGSLVVAGPVGGDIRASTGELRMTDRASVAGNVNYTSDREAQIDPGARVQGTVARQEAPAGPQAPVFNPVLAWARNLLGLFVAGTVFFLLAPRLSRRSVEAVVDSPWASLGLGFALMVAVPVLALIVFGVGLFLGGWWLGPLGMALYAILLVLGFTVAGLALGAWGLPRLGVRDVHPILALLAGLAVLLLLALVPVIGWLVAVVAAMFGLGALALAVARGRREPPSRMAIEEVPSQRAAA